MATATVMGYCMKCKTQREITDSKQVTMKNGRPPLKALARSVVPRCSRSALRNRSGARTCC